MHWLGTKSELRLPTVHWLGTKSELRLSVNMIFVPILDSVEMKVFISRYIILYTSIMCSETVEFLILRTISIF